MDTLFISHGSPMLPLQPEDPTTQFLRNLSNQIEKPKAVLSISAHWETDVPTVNSLQKNTTMYDFYGFPRELYQLTYNAPGSPQLASRVKQLLDQAGFKPTQFDSKRGLDHGAWVPLLLMYPGLDIPVIQLSLQSRKNALHHYKIGQALAPLKNEGVLIMGSGNVTHNMRSIDLSPNAKPPRWAAEFDNWLHDVLTNNRVEDVLNWDKNSNAKIAHPSPEHFLPLLVALGAAGKAAKAEQIHHDFQGGSFSMACYAFRAAHTP